MEKQIKKLLKFTVSEEEFRDMVVNQRMPDVRIAKQLGVCSVTVLHWRQYFGIEQPFTKKVAAPKVPRRKPRLPVDQLRELYIDKRLSQKQIGKLMGVSQATIGNWLEKLGIDALGSGGRISVILDSDELRRLYHDEQWSMEAIAQHFKCGESTVRQNLIRYNLTIAAEEVGRRKSAKNRITFPDRRVMGVYAEIRQIGHPEATQGGYVPEHRVTVEAAIGRYLAHVEQVHHINMVKLNNPIENLALMPNRKTHALVHKYMEKVGVFLLGLTDVRPEPLAFEQPVFWGGEWVESVDLIARSVARSGDPVARLTQSIRENGLKYEFEDAA